MSESPQGPGFVVRQTCRPRLSKTYPVPQGTLVTISLSTQTPEMASGSKPGLPVCPRSVCPH